MSDGARLVRTNRSSSLKANAPLLWRVVAFLGIFVVVSGVLGPRIISGGLLYTYHFAIYGTLGKALLFGVLAFVLLAYRRLAKIRLEPWRAYNLLWLAAAAASFACATIGVNKLLSVETRGAYWPITTHIALLLCIAFAVCGCFGLGNVHMLVRKFKKEILLSLVLAAVFVGFLYAVYGLWEVLAAAVLHSVHSLLGLAGVDNTILPPRDLLFDKFGIEIAQYCSGIESIALFTGLYAVVGLVDREKFNFKRYAIAFLPALLLLFACNILRVTFLIWAGYYISQRIAFSLFHTYAGMVFFILYSAIFWRLTYHWMLRKPPVGTHESNQ